MNKYLNSKRENENAQSPLIFFSIIILSLCIFIALFQASFDQINKFFDELDITDLLK